MDAHVLRELPPDASKPDRLARWRAAHGREALLVAAITLLGAVVRLWRLAELPAGLHGDEAWTGLDALRILREGWIGVYVPSALGQPSGPLYAVAPFAALLGRTTLAVRLPAALAATATIPLLYGVARTAWSRRVAAFAALWMALDLWHLHFSRIGFMVNFQPLAVATATLLIFAALRTGRWTLWAAAGFVLGAGLYAYNAHPLFVVTAGLWLVWLAWPRLSGTPLRRYAPRAALFGAAALLAAWPLLAYALDPAHGFLRHHETVALSRAAAWTDASFAGRTGLLAERAGRFLEAVFLRGVPDYSDAAGWRPMLSPPGAVLVLLGAGALAVRGRRRAAAVPILLALAILPLAAVVTEGGHYRRTLAMTPFLALAAAVPLGWGWRRAGDARPGLRRAARGALVAGALAVGAWNVWTYFTVFPKTALAQYVFCEELAEASRYARDCPGRPTVAFYSARWSWDYETRRYLAPGVPGFDRSSEFGRFTLDRPGPGPTLYLFLDAYLPQAAAVRAALPGGAFYEGRTADGRTAYAAYYLPE